MSDPDFKVVETKKYHPPTADQVGANNRAALAYLAIFATLALSVSGYISSFSLAQYHSSPLQPVQGLTWSILLWLRSMEIFIF